MKIKIKLLFLIAILTLTNCNKIIYRDVKCRNFGINGEYYWFPSNVGDSVVFVNSSNDRRKYIVDDKYISHRTNYVSDTGCGCLDLSGMLLINNGDSIWFNNELRYVENQEGNYYEDLFFVIDGVMSGFYETYKSDTDTYSIDDNLFTDVECFENDWCKDGVCVKKVCRVKGLGIIQFELGSGEIWTNENLTKYGSMTIQDFKYSENTCK